MPGNDGHSRRFRFGAYELDEATRDLRKSGLSIHLQDQPWEVLCALLERHGEVVSREDLRRRLWPDGTFVDYEQSLNKAVNKLREALCDAADRPRYVETLARRGYRFVAAVEEDGPSQGKAIADQPRVSYSRRWWAAGGIGVCLLGLLVTGLWPVPAPKVRVIQLTKGGHLNDPLLAVHGGRILYVAQRMLSSDREGRFRSVGVDGGELRREPMPFLDPLFDPLIRQADPYRGDILIQVNASDTTPGELWLCGFDGSRPRRIGVAKLGSNYSVSPNLEFLLRSDKDGLFIRRVEGGPERMLARIDWTSPSYTFWHPSNSRIGFIPNKQLPVHLWEVKADGTGMKPLVPELPEMQVGGNWSPNGERLYFIYQGEIYVRESRRWPGWMRKPVPSRLTTGSVRYGMPIEDPTDSRRVYARGIVQRGESMKLNRQTGAFELYLDGISAEGLDYSPDGQWIAYVTYPAKELWKCRRNGSGRVMLNDGLQSMVPRWSPDGTRLAFAATRRDRPELPRLYVISAEGGAAEEVKSGPVYDPTWSPDGKRLMFAPLMESNMNEQERHISILNLETNQVDAVPGSDELFSPRWSPDGKSLVAIRFGRYEPVLYEFATKRWISIDATQFGFPSWSKDCRYIFGITAKEPKSLLRIDVATRKVEVLRTITEFRLAGAIGKGVSWTPEGEPVILADLSTNETYRIDVER